MTTPTVDARAGQPATVPAAGRLPRKLLIANRGEIAVRIARTCRDLGVATVAVFSDIDAQAMHVQVCDEAVRLGGASPAESYLRVDALLEAAEVTGADAIHPGYGFLAENAGFARAVLESGRIWVGPTPSAIEAMGDKLEAKQQMAAAGVPVIAGAPLPEGDDVTAVASQVGFPLMVKAAAGGGGKGMRIVAQPDQLADAVEAARREALGAFGDGTVFLERYIQRSRHVEVQVLGDSHGNVVHAFERECSIQRRHQKVVEETPSPGIDAEVRAAICTAAVEAARAIGYVNAGTVEFIVDEVLLGRRRADEDVPVDSVYAFLEVNTRLQVEHPVTEEVVRVRDPATGTVAPLDLVRLQLLIAAGAPLPFAQDDLRQTGHAIEVRLYAEDPPNGFLPATGRLHVFDPVAPTGTRWDTGVRSGDVISTFYDPMLAKVIAYAPTRTEAASVLARALDDTALLGVATNRDLLAAVLRHPAFVAGDTTTGFLDEHFADAAARTSQPTPEQLDTALVAATLADTLRRADRARPRVRPGFVNADTFRPHVRFSVGASQHEVRYHAGRDGSWAFQLDGGTARHVVVHGMSGDRLDLEVDGHRQHLRVASHGRSHAVHTSAGHVTLDEHPRFPEAAAEEVAGATLAPMPGAVVAVAVQVGDAVAKGDLLCTVEAMKMEHRVTAPLAGTVAEVRVVAGQQVDADEILVVVADEVAAS